MFSAKNKFFKYKLLALLLVLLIITDAVIHKGMLRVMNPKTFLAIPPSSQKVSPEISLFNRDKNWMKAINTPEKMKKVDINQGGIEMDIHFDTTTKKFSVHHNFDATLKYDFEELLRIYYQRKLTASIWMDFKNLSPQNQQDALKTLISIREKYHLENKILVESGSPKLLDPFVDQNFYTSYYTPYFNPYLLKEDSLKTITNEIEDHLAESKVQAVSGYYFQLPFLHERFPNFPILIWGSNDKFSLVSIIYSHFIDTKKEVFISLNP